LDLEDKTEADVVVAGDSWVDIACELGGIVDSVEVKFLALICHIYDPGGVLLLGSIAHSCDVCRVVAIATI
jgi:hypothetical protein